MRWDDLFAELEARFEELSEAADRAEMADRERVAAGELAMSQRLGGALARPVRVRTVAGAALSGTLRQIGPDWLLLEPGPDREILVAYRGVALVEGLTARTGAPLAGVALRLDLRRALRGLARDRSSVSITLAGGTEIAGTIDRVGADFLELAVHAPWEPRRDVGVRSAVLVPLGGVVAVTAARWG